MASDTAMLEELNGTSRTLDAQGVAVAIAEAGQGDFVLVIGDPGSALASALAWQFRVVTTPGGDDFASLSPAMKARRIAAIATAGGYAAFALCVTGHDASAAMHLAADMPEAVQKCVLIEPHVYDARGVLYDPSLAEKLDKIACHSLALFGTDGGGNTQAAPSFYRALIPNCHLMYVFEAVDILKDRPDAAIEVIADFLRRGDGFVVSDKDGRLHP